MEACMMVMGRMGEREKQVGNAVYLAAQVDQSIKCCHRDSQGQRGHQDIIGHPVSAAAAYDCK
jgi:hypothetical protein